MRLTTRVSCTVLNAALLSQLSARDTLFYPERCDQIGGRIDPAVVAFDTIGLLLYIIPNLIVFGVDFATGAIYLPDAKYPVASEVLKDAVGADGKVDNRKLETISGREVGRELPLDDPRLIRYNGSVEQLAAYDLKPAA